MVIGGVGRPDDINRRIKTDAEKSGAKAAQDLGAVKEQAKKAATPSKVAELLRSDWVDSVEVDPQKQAPAGVVGEAPKDDPAKEQLRAEQQKVDEKKQDEMRKLLEALGQGEPQEAENAQGAKQTENVQGQQQAPAQPKTEAEVQALIDNLIEQEIAQNPTGDLGSIYAKIDKQHDNIVRQVLNCGQKEGLGAILKDVEMQRRLEKARAGLELAMGNKLPTQLNKLVLDYAKEKGALGAQNDPYNISPAGMQGMGQGIQIPGLPPLNMLGAGGMGMGMMPGMGMPGMGMGMPGMMPGMGMGMGMPGMGMGGFGGLGSLYGGMGGMGGMFSPNNMMNSTYRPSALSPEGEKRMLEMQQKQQKDMQGMMKWQMAMPLVSMLGFGVMSMLPMMMMMRPFGMGSGMYGMGGMGMGGFNMMPFGGGMGLGF